MRTSIRSITVVFSCTICMWVSGLLPGAQAADPIQVGILHRADFAYAKMMAHAYSMALEEINASGGIKGSPLALSFADDKGVPDVGVQAVKSLVRQERVVLLLGGYSSSNTLHMAFAADRLDTPFLVSTAADDHITQHNLENIFRLNPPASQYTQALEAFLLERVRPGAMAIVYENSPYGTGGARRMMAFCRDHGIVINGIYPYFKDAASEGYLQRVLAPIQDHPPEVIFLVAYLKDAVLLVQRAKEMQLDALLAGGAGGFTHEAFSRLAGPASEHLVTATLWSPSSKNVLAQRFRDAYVGRYKKEPDYHAAEAYAALMVSADALRRAASPAAADIRTALGNTDLKTPFGRIAFENFGHYKRQNNAETFVFQIQKGRNETIWPPEAATAPYVPPTD